MKRLLVLCALVVLAAATATTAAGAAPTSRPAARAHPTVATVIRPVTSHGRAAAGFSVHPGGGSTVECGPAEASPVAVDRNIDECSPAAAFPAACWKAARPHHVLCFDDARHHDVRRLPLQGRFGRTAPVANPLPLDMRLGSGAYCGIRIGGSSAPLRHHPQWGVAYYCSRNLAVWARFSSHTDGIDRARPAWTVRVAPADGHDGRLRVRRVAHAWFVGTKH